MRERGKEGRKRRWMTSSSYRQRATTRRTRREGGTGSSRSSGCLNTSSPLRSSHLVDGGRAHQTNASEGGSNEAWCFRIAATIVVAKRRFHTELRPGMRRGFLDESPVPTLPVVPSKCNYTALGVGPQGHNPSTSTRQRGRGAFRHFAARFQY